MPVKQEPEGLELSDVFAVEDEFGFTSYLAEPEPEPDTQENCEKLITAARESKTDELRGYIQTGVDVNGSSIDGDMTALLWAAYNGNHDIVRLLIDAGASLAL